MKRWYVDSDTLIPTEVECEKAGYPHQDAHGRTQFDNTHFDDEQSAWERARSSAEAEISLAASSVIQAEEAMARARSEAAEAVKVFKNVDTAQRRRGRARGVSALPEV